MPNFPLKKFQQHGIDACEHGVVTHLGDASVEKPTARARQYASPNSRTNPARIDSVHKVFMDGHKRRYQGLAPNMLKAIESDNKQQAKLCNNSYVFNKATVSFRHS
jgi:hypothetical protein